MPQSIESELQLVVFSLSGEEYGVPVGRVQEIIRMPGITKIPKMPSYVEGVINLRGRVVPIIDLRQLFELSAIARDDANRVVVVEVDGATLGMTVDNVSEVLRIPVSAVDPPPQVASASEGYFTGVGKLEKRLIMLLDLDKLVPESELREMEASVGA